MRKITKLLTLALAAMMIIGMIPFAASAAFEDVSYDDEALYEAVELLSTLGVAKGTTETTFSPEENVTRQQMAAFVYRLMKAGRSSEGGVNTTPFTDLEDSTFFNMVSWASNAGVIKGTSATTFNPKGGITLQDAYVMLVRALGYENDGPLSYPFGYTDKAEELGLDENIPSTVDYTTTLNRGQVAILLANAFYADMNETTVEYEWITNEDGTANAYVPVETTETIAHKIFGVEEESIVVLATTNYAYGSQVPTYDELKDVETIVGVRYDADGNLVEAAREYELEELGLDCEADELFLAELTVFTKKDSKKASEDEFLAAKSNLIKKTVTAADVVLATSTKTDKEYYVGGVKTADGEKVMTGVVEFGGISAYLDYAQAPYSYKKDYTAADGITFIDLVAGTYDEEDGASFYFADLGIDFTGDYKVSANGSYDNLTVEFANELPLIYNEGLYEADVYDSNGDGYVDFLFVKDYTFVEIVDKKNKDFAGLKNFNSTEYFSIYTENATIEGDYKSGDFVLAYVNENAKYVKVAETIAPIEAMVATRSSSDDSKTVTFKSGETVEFEGAAAKFTAAKYPAYADFKAGKTYKAYIKGDLLLFKDGISTSGNFDADANYAIVLEYDEDPATKYIYNGTEFVKDTTERIVYSATGVVDGEFVTYFYVNAVIDGAVKAVQLADYANTFVNYKGNGSYELNAEIDDQKITEKEVAETVMYNDFLNKFSTYTVDSDGAYTFTALDIDSNTANFADKDEELAVYLEAASANIKNFTGSIYNITGMTGLSKFTLKDYSKLIIKTVDEDGEDVYTIYTSKNLPEFAETTFTNVKAVFVNNTKSTYENLGILYAEIDEFASDVVYDYRIVLSAKTIADEDGKEKNLYTVLDVTNATTAGDIELAKGVADVAAGDKVLMNDDGKIAGTATIGSTYVEDKMFKASFTGDYEEANKFLNIGDGNTYLISDDTTILYYTSTSIYQMAEDDIFTTEENDYEGLEDLASFTLYIVADEIDDNTTDSTIKAVKTVIVTK